MPSSLRFFSICLLLARAARSSALIAQPIFEHQLVIGLILAVILADGLRVPVQAENGVEVGRLRRTAALAADATKTQQSEAEAEPS